VVRVACGIGVEQCAISLKKLFEMQVVRFLVFVGFAGGVSPEWGVGDVVWVDRVVGSDGAVNRIRPTPVDKVRLTHDVRRGTVVTTARVASTRQSKAALLEAWGSHDVVAVDMESSAVALTANAYGVDCVILRAISDTYDHDIPEEAIRAIASDGRVDLAVLLRGCLLRPGAVCDLVRLGIASRRASRRLAKVALQVLGSLRAAEASGSN
jgi:nucleoside phosphorylase